MDPYSSLRPIMERCGTKLTAEEFHSAVNVIFHGFESEHYDEAHQNMWDSLPREFALLCDDLAAAGGGLPAAARMLDIGCGTGLATDCFLRTGLGSQVAHVTLLDSSAAMLERAGKRARNWKTPVTAVEGLLDSVSTEPPFDVIITSSVLHHVPDLPAFFSQVAARQRSGGIFLHIQDPNGGIEENPAYRQRQGEWQKLQTPAWAERLSPKRIAGRIWRELSGSPDDNYDAQAVRALVEKGVTPLPLTIPEMYRITDIHVNSGEGIRVGSLKALLPDYELIRSRTYGFFGVLPSELPPEMQSRERELSDAVSQEGFHVGAMWRRR